MCGILFIASAAGNRPQASGSASDYPDAIDHIGGGGNGGGDDSNGSPFRLTFAGSILQLRGNEPVSPPLIDTRSGNILLWNGEIFNDNTEVKETLNIPAGGNDAKALLDALTATSDIPAVFSSIRGPWACAFWHAKTETLWFGRDVLGRRSLLAKWPTQIDGIHSSGGGGGGGGGRLNDSLGSVVPGSSFILTSLVPLDPGKGGGTEPIDGYVEVEPGLYKIKIKELSNCRLSANHNGNSGIIEVASDETFKNTSVSSIEDKLAHIRLNDEGVVTAVDWQNEALIAIKAFHRREKLINPAADEEKTGEGQEIDDNDTDIVSKDKLLQSQVELKEENEKERGKRDPGPAVAAMNAAAVEGILSVLRDAVRVRCHCIDTPSHSSSFSSSISSQILEETKELNQEEENGELEMLSSSVESNFIIPAKLMILFSGGVDSTLLSALAHEYRPPDEPIDLVSICFAAGTSPDREAALSAFEELKKIAPNRPWRLIGADKVLQDVENARERLLKLLYPSDTVMDLNIGAALWLAAAGEGEILRLGGGGDDQILDRKDLGQVGMQYRSAARCVFLGHGADELFGGYGRHRTRFRNGGWQGLSDELALDVKRLWVRNLGRDDRLVADRGREARHPFLDERLILEALQNWPLSCLTDLRMDLGVGDKLVLREILRKLGLPEAAKRVKRAIQFGTRLAKVTNAAQFGGTRQANNKNAGRVRLADVQALSAP